MTVVGVLGGRAKYGERENGVSRDEEGRENADGRSHQKVKTMFLFSNQKTEYEM